MPNQQNQKLPLSEMAKRTHSTSEKPTHLSHKMNSLDFYKTFSIEVSKRESFTVL